jgi:hypothetical protein
VQINFYFTLTSDSLADFNTWIPFLITGSKALKYYWRSLHLQRKFASVFWVKTTSISSLFRNCPTFDGRTESFGGTGGLTSPDAMINYGTKKKILDIGVLN